MVGFHVKYAPNSVVWWLLNWVGKNMTFFFVSEQLKSNILVCLCVLILADPFCLWLLFLVPSSLFLVVGGTSCTSYLHPHDDITNPSLIDVMVVRRKGDLMIMPPFRRRLARCDRCLRGVPL